jgi:hypothetical protein
MVNCVLHEGEPYFCFFRLLDSLQISLAGGHEEHFMTRFTALPATRNSKKGRRKFNLSISPGGKSTGHPTVPACLGHQMTFMISVNFRSRVTKSQCPAVLKMILTGILTQAENFCSPRTNKEKEWNLQYFDRANADLHP